MTVIVVANPKGGVGKSTLSTNLAGAFAASGEWVALADLDRQQSSHGWLALRPEGLPPIETWRVDPDAPAKPPRGLERAVVDTPAGLHGARLSAALELADKVVVPLQPSMFDILATQHFLERLARVLERQPRPHRPARPLLRPDDDLHPTLRAAMMRS